MKMSGLEAGPETPEVSILLRMFSTLAADSDEQLFQAFEKQPVPGVPVQESKTLAGKVTI